MGRLRRSKSCCWCRECIRNSCSGWIRIATACSIRFWQGALLVNAPDYIHRGIGGYPYWPAEYTIARTVDSRRYVTMTIDTGIAEIEGLDPQPVTAVVPGQPGGSGGGNPPPPPPPP